MIVSRSDEKESASALRKPVIRSVHLPHIEVITFGLKVSKDGGEILAIVKAREIGNVLCNYKMRLVDRHVLRKYSVKLAPFSAETCFGTR